MIPVKASHGGVSFAVKVQPRARRNAITGLLGEALKLALTAPPVEGRANEAVIKFFAALFEIPRSSVTIASGATNRIKRVHVAGITPAIVQQRLQRIFENV